MLRARPSSRRVPVRGAARLLVRAEPAKGVEAGEEEECDGGDEGECGSPWGDDDEEEPSSSSAAKADPLEEFCGNNPDADECRTYED
eukprot:jgi/Tetstr1/465827/TSEL_010447.t1